MSRISYLFSELVNGPVDFYGQTLCTTLIYSIPAVGAVVAVALGYQAQDFDLSLKVIAATILLTIGVCIPAWPFYARNQIQWKTVKEEK